jgi:hypothetical protein
MATGRWLQEPGLQCEGYPQDSPFLCLLSFGDAKESEAPPAGRNGLAEKQQKQPRRSTSPNPRQCQNPRTPGSHGTSFGRIAKAKVQHAYTRAMGKQREMSGCAKAYPSVKPGLQEDPEGSRLKPLLRPKGVLAGEDESRVDSRTVGYATLRLTHPTASGTFAKKSVRVKKITALAAFVFVEILDHQHVFFNITRGVQHRT